MPPRVVGIQDDLVTVLQEDGREIVVPRSLAEQEGLLGGPGASAPIAQAPILPTGGTGFLQGRSVPQRGVGPQAPAPPLPVGPETRSIQEGMRRLQELRAAGVPPGERTPSEVGAELAPTSARHRGFAPAAPPPVHEEGIQVQPEQAPAAAGAPAGPQVFAVPGRPASRQAREAARLATAQREAAEAGVLAAGAETIAGGREALERGEQRTREAENLIASRDIDARVREEEDREHLAAFEERTSDSRRRYQELQQRLTDTEAEEVDRGRFWADASTGSKILSAISLFFGFLSQARGGTNPAIDMINTAIEEDIAEQRRVFGARAEGLRAAVGEARNGFGSALRELGDEREALIATRQAAHQRVRDEFQMLASVAQSEEERAAFEVALGQIDQRIQGLRLQFASASEERAARAARGRRSRLAGVLPNGTVLDLENAGHRAIWQEMMESGQVGSAEPRQLSTEVGDRNLDTLTRGLVDLQDFFRRHGGWPEGMGWDEFVTGRLPGFVRGLIEANDPAAQELRQLSNNVGRVYVFALSGKQTNQNEVDQLNDARLGEFRSPEQLIIGTRMITRIAQDQWRTVRAMADDSTWTEWNRRRGLPDPIEQLGFGVQAESAVPTLRRAGAAP